MVTNLDSEPKTAKLKTGGRPIFFEEEVEDEPKFEMSDQTMAYVANG